MEGHNSSNAAITERYKKMNCPEAEKQDLHKYLMSILAEGKSFLLKRNKVMIMEQENKNRFIILERIDTTDDCKYFYICPLCSNVKFSSYLTEKVSAEEFRACVHSKVCQLLWGDMPDLRDNGESDDDDKETDLVEVVTEKPRYVAVVHPATKRKKVAGVVTLTTKTLKPRCLVCKGQDKCIHLTIHYTHYKSSLEESEDDDITKKIRLERLEPQKPKKNKINELDPYLHDGPDANVFHVRIDFLKIKETVRQPFNKKILVPRFDPEEVCKNHGNRYDNHESILDMESSKVIIHHTKDVDSSNIKVLFRPTISKSEGDGCACKKWYSGQEDQLLRVSSADENMKGRSRTLHFVTYEFYFDYLSKLLISGEPLHAQIKAKRFMEENFFGNEKKPEYKKVLQKGFEIFIHALEFPEDANYCYECPQELESGEKEDDFKDDIEYSIIDGIQMGCRSNSLKTDIEDEFFQEAVVEGIVVNGIESKDRTFCRSQNVRSVLATLLRTADEPSALRKAVEALNKLEIDANSRSVLNLLNRLLLRNRTLPKGYRQFLHELHLPTPISALLTPYSSEKHVYELFMSYLNNKFDIFSTPSSLEVFTNRFPVLVDCMKEILQTEVLHAETSVTLKRNIFLPHDVSDILKNLIKLRFDFDKLSRKVAVPRTSPNSEFEPPLADFFPAYPIHTMENIYKADSKVDNAEKADCDKNFDSASTISGGIGTVSCNHKVTKGFRAIQKGESPLLFCNSLFRRLPQKVKAHKRVVIYDFACKLHKVCLRRYPYRIRRFQFVIDRYHQTNHTACSESYNISKYPEMAHVNTQIAEQLNNSLRKLSTVVAYSNFKTYLRIIQVFITVKNLQIKRII